jgi:hypothetical protein
MSENATTGKDERAAFRLSAAEAAILSKKLSQTNIGKSEYCRRAVLGVPIHSATDQQMVSELKRLGALMKHQYPKHSNWLDHEKRDYWQLMNQLNDLARKLQENILKGQ